MKDIFSCDDVWSCFVKLFSPHVESVNDKKREALLPTASLPPTISLSASTIYPIGWVTRKQKGDKKTPFMVD